MPPDSTTYQGLAMFFASNVYGFARLTDAYHSLPIPTAKKLAAVSKFLGITEKTLTNYLTGKSDPPRAVVYAIWHESPDGRAVTSAQTFREAQAERALTRSLIDVVAKKDLTILALSQELARLKLAQPENVCANDPVFKYQ